MQDQLKDFTTINQVQAQIFTQSTIDQSTQKQITQKTDQLTNLTKIKQNGNIIMLIQQNSEHLKQKFHFSLEKYFNLSIKTQLQQKIASNQEIDNIYFNLQDDLDQHLINILQNLITNENTLLRQFFNKMYGLNQIAHLQKLKLEQFYVKAFKVELRKHLKLEISFRLYDEDNINEQEQIVNQHYLLTKSKKQYLKINEVYISKLEQLKLETYYLALSKNLNYLKKLQSFNNQIEGQIANIQSKQIILLTIKLQESILKGILSTNQIKLKRIILNNKNEDLQTKQNSLSQIQRQTVLNLISKNKINQSQNKQQLLAVKSIFQNKQNQILKIQNDKCKLLGGGSCGSKGKDQTLNSVAKNQKQKQMQQIMSQKEQLKDKFQIYSDQEQENNDKFKQQMTKHMDGENQFDDFALEIQDEKEIENYYDQQGNQGSNDSYSILKLEKITESDIKEYLMLFRNQKEQEEQSNFHQEKHEKLQEIIFKNKQLVELLKLPINLYLTSRMIADLDLNDQNISSTFQAATDQIEIQELFFNNQFKKQSQLFAEKLTQIQENKKYELIEVVQQSFFEYFQTISMHMFLQKGQKSNYLSTTKNSVKFQLREDVSNFLNKQKIKKEELIQHLNSYVDSRVITRIQLNFDGENKNHQQKLNEDISQEFEFRHKSLFEYFAARAMKHDFDLHKEDIHKLNISQLNSFNINKKIIMDRHKNTSEQQILLKLFKLMNSFISSQQFLQNQSLTEISQTNRYIQYLRKSQINNNNKISEIDIGASNLLSALFLSKFTFPNLKFNKCSFSQAFIPYHSPKAVEFQDCNLENSYIEGQSLENFETSNTKNALLTAFQKQFDTNDIYQFNKILFNNNTIISITESGFVNKFNVMQNNVQSTQNFLSNQIANASLKSIHLFDAKKLLVITTKMSVFEVDTKTLKVINSFKFSHSIANLSINKSKYMITLSSRQIYLGDIQNGFTLLDPHKIQAEKALFFNNLIITSVSNKITLYNLQDLSIIKTNEESNCDLNISSISIDGKFLAVAYKNTCQIYNLEKEFGLIHTIQEHSSPITSIAFSSNNKYLATSSEDFTCKLWNIENNFEFIHKIQAKTICFNFVAFSHDSKYIATASKINCKLWSLEKQFEQVDCIQGHFQPITSVAFSPNCKYFASSSEDNTFNVWNLQNGCQLIKSIKEKENWITSIAFSADNKYLATGSWDKTCRIYDIESDFKLSYTIQLENPIAAIAFSSDGKYLATGSYENSCKIWNAQKAFELLYTIKGHSWEVVSVTFSSDVKYLATGSVDNTCKIWVVEKGFELLHTIQGHKNKISSVCFSSDSKYLATGSEDQTSKIWDVEKKFELIKTISEHKKQITSVSFSADGRYFATGSEDNTCKLFSVQNGFDLVSTIQRNINWITSLTFSADGKYLAIGTHNSDCKIFNTEKGFEIIDKNQCHTLEITSVAISADGKYLATGSSDNSCKIWNIQKGFQLITTIVGHTKEISTVAFSGDGKFLVTGSKDNTCKIWSVEKGFEYLTTIKEHIYFISSINFSADGKYLATGSEDNTCIVWSVSEQFTLIQKIKQHESKITSVSFSADSKYLATGSFDNTCKIWNVENGFQLMKSIEDQTQEITSVAFSQDGKYLATGLKDNTCKIWNVLKNFELFQVIQGHNSVVTSVSFSSNSKYLSTASKDKTFKIWDIERGFQLIDTIEAHISSITSITFSADSKYIITGSEDKSCKIWNLEKILEVQSQHKLMKTQETVIQADKVQKQSTISEVEANYIKLMYQI
ncbi:hypothetical protein ABPG73_017017 [Tetrahymena malaccensis]